MKFYIVETSMESVRVYRRDLWMFFNELDADIFCIQESKMQAGQLELDMPGYHQYWNYAEKKGYSGTGILQRRTGISKLWSGNRRT